MSDPGYTGPPLLNDEQWKIAQIAATLLAGNSAIYHGRSAEARVARVVELAYAIAQEVATYPAVDFAVGASEHYREPPGAA